jgi:hypothetical protein
VTPTRAAKLLTFVGNVVAVVVILDTLIRLGRDELMPASSAETAADRLRADPALSRHLPVRGASLGHQPISDARVPARLWPRQLILRRRELER